MPGGRTYYFYKVFRRTIIQFLDMFNDIQVARYDSNGTQTGTILVPLKYGPKEKAYYWLKEYSTEEKLPIMTVNLMSIDFDSARMVNKNQTVVQSQDIEARTETYFPNPVPYNLMLNLNIWALHMVDIDQIIEQILPYFNNYTMMRVHIPELGAYLENKVIFSSAVPDIMDEWGEEDWRVLKWTLTFTVQMYMFRPLSGETDGKLIDKIMARIYTTRTALETETETTFTSGASGNYDEAVYLEGIGVDETAKVLYNYEIFPKNGR